MLACSVMSDSDSPRTVAHQAPLSMGFFRQEYWSGLPFPPPGDLPDPGTEPASLEFSALECSLPLLSSGKPVTDCERNFLLNVHAEYFTMKIGFAFRTLVQFSRSVVSDSLPPHESQHARPPCPSPSPGVHSDSRPSSP